MYLPFKATSLPHTTAINIATFSSSSPQVLSASLPTRTHDGRAHRVELLPFPPPASRTAVADLGAEHRAREVVIAGNKYRDHGRQPTPPPPLLHACAESRSCIQRFYTECSLGNHRNPSAPLQHYWINLDIDSLYTMDYHFEDFSPINLIRRLTLVSNDSEDFYRYYFLPHVRKAEALETLTVIDQGGAPADTWFLGWADVMEVLYFRCDSAPFYTKIVHRELVLTPDNWLKLDRQWRRKEWGPDLEENPHLYGPDDAVPEDDDDPRDSRFRPGWHHSEDCECPQKKARR